MKLRRVGRKAQANGILSQAPAVIVIIVILAVILGVGSTVLDKIQDTQLPITAKVTNETFTASNTSFTNLGAPAFVPGSVTVSNASGALTSNNFTVSDNTGGIQVTDFHLEGVLLNATYTSSTGSSAFNATQDGLIGLDAFSDFQPTIAVILVAVIIIGLLLSGFAFVQTRRQ